jgi:HEAT repeat protein
LLPADSGQPDLLNVERELARRHLHDSDSSSRVCAIQLAMLPGVDLQKEIVPLLEDSSPEVRRAAMLAVGHASGPQQAEVIATEDLLRWLHDTDDDVRRICEAALRGRGLQDEHVRIGRLVTDTRPTVRLQVLDSIRSNPDLEPGIWLRTLTHDPAPEVRVAAVRAAAEHETVDLTDRIDQMARSDPSPTVCQIARFYLNYPKSRTNRVPQP